MNLEVAKNTLLHHSRSEKNGIFPSSFTHSAKITNPLCGDHVELRVSMIDSRITDIGHKANACAICSASASLLCEEIRGISIEEALHLSSVFEKSVMEDAQKNWPEEIKGLICFEHLKINPSRKVCALLPWTTLKKALKSPQGH